MPEIETGKVLEQRYCLISKLGAGASSTVYLALDQVLNRQVAIKMLHWWSSSGTALQRFERESRALSRLMHPNIIQVFKFANTGDEAFLVMEYARGESLRELLKRQGPLACSDALAIALQICAALQYAHGAEIIHRDLKPENVIIAKNGDVSVKVFDFGLCKEFSPESLSQSGTLTAMGSSIGTAAYMSPEQALGEPCDYRSDIYSFGCLLFELITGSPPFSADSPGEILFKQTSEPTPSILKMSPESGLPQSLEDLIIKCTAKNKNDRYQSTGELSEALIAVAGLNCTAVFAAGSKKRRALSKTAGALLLLLTLSAGALLLFFSNTGEGKLFLAGQIQTGLQASRARPLLRQMHEDLLKSGNKETARRLAKQTTSSPIYRFWPPCERLGLLQAYIASYRTAGLDEDAFAGSVDLLENALNSIRRLQSGQKPPEDLLTVLSAVSQELYRTPLSKKQWSAISHVFETRSGVFPREEPGYLLWPSALRCAARSNSEAVLSANAGTELTYWYQYGTRLALNCNNSELLFSLSREGLRLCHKWDLAYYEHLIRADLCRYYLMRGQINQARQELARTEKVVKNLLLSGAETECMNDLRKSCGVGKLVELPREDPGEPVARAPLLLHVLKDK